MKFCETSINSNQEKNRFQLWNNLLIIFPRQVFPLKKQLQSPDVFLRPWQIGWRQRYIITRHEIAARLFLTWNFLFLTAKQKPTPSHWHQHQVRHQLSFTFHERKFSSSWIPRGEKVGNKRRKQTCNKLKRGKIAHGENEPKNWEHVLSTSLGWQILSFN